VRRNSSVIRWRGIILVADDIDITDIDQVVWAMATHYHPGTGEHLYPDTPGIPVVPYLTADEVRTGRGGKSVMSCLQPEQLEGGDRGTVAGFRHSYPEDVRQRVLGNWTAYGFPAPGPR
jgi:4-hydroxy-3-polyprenylbenzoate decarboxylase